MAHNSPEYIRTVAEAMKYATIDKDTKVGDPEFVDVPIDELLGKDEYVIKSLGSNLEDVEGISGGAILADGRVGLILDIHGIFSIVSRG